MTVEEANEIAKTNIEISMLVSDSFSSKKKQRKNNEGNLTNKEQS